MATALVIGALLPISLCPGRVPLRPAVPRHRVTIAAAVPPSDEAPAGGLQQTGADGGIAKTAAVAALGAQLQAQSNARARGRQAGGFTGVIEIVTREGCAQCASALKALQGLGIAAERLVERDVDAPPTPDASDRVEHARASGVPQVYVLREGQEAERIVSLWMEIGSGALQRRLAS